MPTRSLSEPGLPWESGRTFRVWGYGIGHSHLLLRSVGLSGQQTINVLFEAVELMKLRRTYPDLVIRRATDEEEPVFSELAELPVRLLHLALSSTSTTGFVACSRVVASVSDDPEDLSLAAGDLLFSVHART
ncbi:hypothetical protein [Catellatospora sichuanensis]|uniref:hypothetical protein n=1 Tax=Catellatospora sichuanensis TaxID=1969805 RepID=UPI001182F33C|nr:hypothetical protein [Catellatospora sichuanensis]